MTEVVPENSPKRPAQKKQNRLGSYNLLQTLGEGEFGKVKLGIHTETGQEVAIKLIRKDGAGSESRISKVEREISVLKILKHPRIVKLYSVIETEKYIGIILEYASGGELFEYILAHRHLKEKDAKKFFSQLISSVYYMHQKNIVHRDLKLENLLLDKNRNIIVTDFGFANQFSSSADDLMATTCGSPCYAAPELVVNSGLYAGSAVDIWSCGVILYAMLCGFLPFDDDPTNPDSDNINQLYRYIMSTHVIFPSHVTADARDLLQKMLVPDPAKRCSVKDIMNHPWLVEYTDVLAEDTAKLESKSVAVTDSVELSNKRKTQNMIEGETVLSRKTNVPKPRDHFSPVTNEKFQDNKQRALPPSQRTNRNNFLISRAAATTTITQETIQKVPTRISKVPNFISRKPIKKEAVEPSFSTPTHRDAPNFTLGSLRMSQRRGPAADKFLSFFTGKPAQSQEHEKKEDLSTLGDSSLSLCNSSVVELPATPVSAIQHSSATEEEEEEIEIEEEEEEEEEEEINEHNVIGTSDTIMEEDSPVQITEHGHNSTCASLPSDNSLAIETRISIQEVPRRSVQVVTPEHINTPPLREITQEMTSPCSPKPVPEPSQSSRRVAVANAVTDGGRKTMAAMRRSIYRKKVPESNRVKEPVLMFAKSRFDEAQRKSLEVSSNKQGRKTGNKMMDWIKKKSHAKEVPKEPVRPAKITPTSQVLTKSRNKEPLQKAKEAVNHTPKIKNSPRKTMIPMKQDVVIQIPTPTRHIRSVSGGEAALTAALEKEESSADSRIKIHTGPVDRTALTSHDPSITIKEIARILRILGIDTKDDGPFVLKCSRRKAKSFSTAESKADYESENNQRPPAGRLTGVSSFNNLRANGIISSFDFKPVQRIPEPIYGDASIDNGDEVRFIAEICRFRHLPGLYIVNIRRLKGNAWAYKFLYHKLIDFLDLGKDGYITMQL